MFPLISIQVHHPLFDSDKKLLEFLSSIEILNDLDDAIQLHVEPIIIDEPCIEIIIIFDETEEIKLIFNNIFSRRIRFLNAKNDKEKMQQVLDILINCWAKQGLIGIDFSDVLAVLEKSEHGFIDNIPDTKLISEYCGKLQLQKEYLNNLKIESILCIYREHDPQLTDFGYYAQYLDDLVIDTGTVVVGVIPVEDQLNPQNAVVYIGYTGKINLK